MKIPEVQYVRSGDVHIAYQVFGEGPDLVFTPGGFNHLLMRWELPANARLFRHMSSFSRVITWDKRGTGLSDRHGRLPTLEAQMEDLQAVMDAAGSRKAVLFGTADGASLSGFFAATYPDRVAAVILYGIGPRFVPGDDGLGVNPDFLAAVQSGLPPEETLRLLAPSAADDPAVLEWWARNSMMSVSPGAIEELLRIWMGVDVTAVLPAIRVPTTVIQRSGDLVLPPPNGRRAAELIPDARYVELPGDFAYFAGDTEALLDEVEEIVTGARHGTNPDRMLATILFTDIVGSTTSAADLGDDGWRALLDEHDAFIARQVQGLNGRLVKSLGDGVLATFDSPARAIRCAADVVDGMRARGADIRAGVHTGECLRRGDDLGGIAVHIAARVGALAEGGEVLVTGTVRDLVFGSNLSFDDRGEHELRGVPGKWRLLAVARG